MIRPTLLFFIFAFLLSACASKDFAEPGIVESPKQVTQKTYLGNYADVWEATIYVLENQRYPLAISQKESGVIITDWILGKSDRLFSGYGESRIPYNIRYKLSFSFKPSRKGVQVSIDNQEQYMTDAITAGSEMAGSLYQWISTRSSTRKEAALLADIDSRLAQAQGRSKEIDR